jgi:hypothetical protein
MRVRQILHFIPAFYALACMSEAPNPEPSRTGDVTPSSPILPGEAEKKTVLLGTYTGSMKSGALTLRKGGGKASPSALPQAFGQVSDTLFGIETTDSGIAGTNVGGTLCPPSRFCAQVNVDNATGKAYQDIFIEITSITPGYEGANSVTLSPTFDGYPLDASKGLWLYGDLANGDSSNVRWEFLAPDTNDFTFQASVFATRIPLSYSVVSSAGGTFVDACSLSGATTVLVSDSGNGSVAASVPFPFNIYEQKFTPAGGNFGITARGVLGFSAASSGPSGNLPASETDFGYSFAAMWGSLQTSASGVCYASQGSPGSRSFYATWTHASFGGGEDLTFTASVDEATDQIHVVYSTWGKDGTTCHTNTASRGANTIIGIQGDATHSAQLGTYAGAKLPSIGTFGACPPQAFSVTMFPSF